jgi:hypothetical protein
LDIPRRSSDSNMKAVIIYDDLPSATKAYATLQRVGLRPEVRVCWTITLWRVDIMKEATVAKNALLDAQDAHLIVFAGRSAQSIPSRLRHWLERWAALRRIPNAAVAVIPDSNARFAVPNQYIFIQQLGLAFIGKEGTVARNAMNLMVRYSREPELPLAFVRCYLPDPQFSPRGWGLNE